jgi:hypothetical protein
MTTVATPSSRRLHTELAASASVSRAETAVVRSALALIALHFVDDNFVQPQPGTAAGDHLASGLVPLTALAIAATLYSRLRAGARAATAMTLGAIGITIGVPGAYSLLDGGASGADYSGLVAILAGAGALVSGSVTLWKARRTAGRRTRRYLRRAVLLATGALTAWLVVFPVGFSYIYTHAGKGPVTPDLGVPMERVTVRTSDSLRLTGYYVLSRNRAAIVLYPGATRPKQARMLIRHGYGVLLLDPRGQGMSEGDIVRWAGDRDILAGAAYLQQRPDVDQDRIGALGFSVGGEILIEAAAQSTALKAVVSEGAGFRMGEADTSGLARVVDPLVLKVMTAATTVFSNHGPPPPIVNRIGHIAPRPVMLIYADPGMGGETVRQPKYYAAAREPKTIWKVTGARHTGGIDARPADYERRVIDFFDRTLVERGLPTEATH